MHSAPSISTYHAKYLSKYIEAFKIYHFNDTTNVQLLPKGIFEIVFQSQHSFQHCTEYSSGWKLRPRHFVGGLHHKAYQVNPGQKQNYCIVVEFKPETAKYFIPEKLDSLQNAVVDIQDIWGTAARKLIQKLDRAKQDSEKIAHIEQFLLDQFNATPISVIDQTLLKIHATRGFIEQKQLATHSGLSSSQFRKRFREEIGIAPSHYCKILRAKTSVSMISHKKDLTLTDITYQLGYFDQSHFIRDFKSIMGTTPKQYQTNHL
ncbi:MAG: helix-turn-helix domain-containing protein [Saprospiraceae bacterium]|nr:helix-turn-helix domain-containing protein [Saprospiraceae bacterium]